MVGVTADVPATRAVYGPAAVDLVQVAAAARLHLLRLFIREPTALIFDDEGVLLDRFGREQAKPGTGAADAVRFFLARHTSPIRRFGEKRTSPVLEEGPP